MDTNSVINNLFVDIMSLKNNRSFLLVLMVVGLCFAELRFAFFIYLIVFISMAFLGDEKGVYSIYFAPVSKKSSVCGRYFLALILFITAFAVCLLADLTIPILYKAYIGSSIYFYMIVFAAYSLLVSIEMPLFYWKGYSKVRMFHTPVLLLSFGLSIKFLDAETTLNVLNTQLLVIILAVALLIALCSLFLSVKIYEKRDL